MTLAELSWPEAVVQSTFIATAGLVLVVLIWSIFRTARPPSGATVDSVSPSGRLSADLEA